MWPSEAFACICVLSFPTYFVAPSRVHATQINLCEDCLVRKLLRRRLVSGDAVSRRRRRSHSSASPMPKLFTSCVHFSKCSKDLGAKKNSIKTSTLIFDLKSQNSSLEKKEWFTFSAGSFCSSLDDCSNFKLLTIRFGYFVCLFYKRKFFVCLSFHLKRFQFNFEWSSHICTMNSNF